MTSEEIIKVMVAFTLCAVVLAIIGACVIGLFDPRVDNAAVFELLKQPLSGVMGSFVTYLALKHGGKS